MEYLTLQDRMTGVFVPVLRSSMVITRLDLALEGRNPGKFGDFES